MIPLSPDPTIDTMFTIFLSALILGMFGWFMYAFTPSRHISHTSNRVSNVLLPIIIPQKTREEQFQEIHNRYFRGRNSRIGRAIRYIEENKKDV